MLTQTKLYYCCDILSRNAIITKDGAVYSTLHPGIVLRAVRTIKECCSKWNKFFVPEPTLFPQRMNMDTEARAAVTAIAPIGATIAQLSSMCDSVLEAGDNIGHASLATQINLLTASVRFVIQPTLKNLEFDRIGGDAVMLIGNKMFLTSCHPMHISETCMDSPGIYNEVEAIVFDRNLDCLDAMPEFRELVGTAEGNITQYTAVPVTTVVDGIDLTEIDPREAIARLEAHLLEDWATHYYNDAQFVSAEQPKGEQPK